MNGNLKADLKKARVAVGLWINRTELQAFGRDDLIWCVKPITGWHPVHDVKGWIDGELRRLTKKGFLEMLPYQPHHPRSRLFTQKQRIVVSLW